MTSASPTPNSISSEPDELGVSVAIYSSVLEPERMTAMLGCEPSASHLIGERAGPQSPPFERNAWFLKQRYVEPFSVDQAVEELLARIPAELPTWKVLATHCEVQVRLALHTDKGTRLHLSSSTVDAVANRSGTVVEDVYDYSDDA